MHVQTFNNNLKELGVVKSKRRTIRKGFVHKLLNAQDTVLCSYLHKDWLRKVVVAVTRTRWKRLSKDWTDLNKYWWDTVRWNMSRKAACGKYKQAGWHWKVGAGREI